MREMSQQESGFKTIVLHECNLTFFASDPAESPAITCLWAPHPVSQQTSPGSIFTHCQALLNILSSQRPCLYQRSKSFRKYLSDVLHPPAPTHWLCINVNSSAWRTGPVALLLGGILFDLPLSCKCVGPYHLNFATLQKQTLTNTRTMTGFGFIINPWMTQWAVIHRSLTWNRSLMQQWFIISR